MKKNKKNRNLTANISCALLIALVVIFSHFLAIQTPAVRISFAFIPLALSGMLFGPYYGFAVGAIADVLGVLLFNTGVPHPGITLVTALSGMIYGMFLYENPEKPELTKKQYFLRLILATLIINIPLEMGLNTFWLSQILDKGVLAILPARAVKQMVMLVVEVLLLPVVRKTIVQPMMKYQLKHVRA